MHGGGFWRGTGGRGKDDAQRHEKDGGLLNLSNEMHNKNEGHTIWE